jgi:hypothetical protein
MHHHQPWVDRVTLQPVSAICANVPALYDVCVQRQPAPPMCTLQPPHSCMIACQHTHVPCAGISSCRALTH